MLGPTLGHYRVLAKLGEGAPSLAQLRGRELRRGLAEAERGLSAEDTKLGRRVALKLLPPEMAADPERLERFQREARAVAALTHPNIVTLYSVEEAEGLHFLTMELVEGQTLAEVHPGRGPAARGTAPAGGPARRCGGGGARARDHPPGPEAGQRDAHERTAG